MSEEILEIFYHSGGIMVWIQEDKCFEIFNYNNGDFCLPGNWDHHPYRTLQWNKRLRRIKMCDKRHIWWWQCFKKIPNHILKVIVCGTCLLWSVFREKGNCIKWKVGHKNCYLCLILIFRPSLDYSLYM